MKTQTAWWIPCAVALTLASQEPVSGQTAATPAAEPDSIIAAYRLEEVVVYGEAPRVLGMMTRLRGEQLKELGGGDAAHLLRLDPGLTVTAGGKAETEARLRGLPARATLILIDGRPVNPGYYGKVDLTMVAVSGLSALQVVKGPVSAAYGPNALGGVVNIITRSGFDAPGTDFSARFGADGLRRLSLGHAERRGAFGFAVHGYEQSCDGFRLSEDFQPTSLEDGGLRDGSGYRKAGGGLKAGYERNDRDIYTLTLDYHWSRRDIPTTIYTWEAPTWRRFPHWLRYGASLNNQRRLGQALELVTVLYADGQHDRLIDYLDRELSAAAINWDSRLENRTYGGSLRLAGAVTPRHHLQTGFTYQHDTMNKQPEADAPWDRHTLGTGSFYMEDRFTPRGAIAVSGGAQISWHAAEGPAKTRLALSPSLAAQWMPTRATALRAAYSRAVRYPTLHTLYSQTSGNPDLRPETADKYEVGLEHRFFSSRGRTVGVEVSWFRNDLTDMIDRAARVLRFENVRQARLIGIETAVRADISKHLEISAGYIWIDRGASTAEIMREQPPHRLTLGITAGTRLGTRLRYDLSALDQRTSHIPGRLHGAYQIHSLTIRQPLRRGLTLHGEVYNLGDAHFEEELGYPAPGRTFTCGFDWKI